MSDKLINAIVLVLRIVIAAIFIYAGWIKLQAPQGFADSIAAYTLLPDSLINILALTLPVFELMIGFLLVVGWQRRLAIFSALILTAVFMVALTSAIARGLSIDCGCFGTKASAKSDLWLASARDLGLASLLVLVYLREIGMLSIKSTWGTPDGVSVLESGEAEI